MTRKILSTVCCYCLFYLCHPWALAQVSNENICTQVQCVKVQNGHLWVLSSDNTTYVPYFVKSVGYDPMPVGRHASDWGYLPGDPRTSINNIFDDPSILNRDFTLLQGMNANTIRLWKGDNTTESNGRYPNKLTVTTLDLAQQYNLKIIAGFWVNALIFDGSNNISTTDGEGNPVSRQQIINNFVAYVNAFKGNKGLLFWAIGNENNYTNADTGAMYSSQQLAAWYALVNDMALAVHQAEGSTFHPVAVVNGEIATIGSSADGSTDALMPDLDIWGANIYRGKSFGTLFKQYSRQSHKPLWISEFGIDAWTVTNATGINNWGSNPNEDKGYEDQPTQSAWDTALWQEIFNNSAVSLGGSVMEYSDEWWKPYEWYCTVPNPTNDPAIQQQNTDTANACNSTQNHFADSFGAFPDKYMNQEWFGVTAIKPSPVSDSPDQMLPRQVYHDLGNKWKLDPWARLTLNLTGIGMAAVTSTPGGLHCTSGSSAGCSAEFPKNQPVALNIDLQNNSYVTKWGGCRSTGSSSCTVTPDGNLVISMAFNLNFSILASTSTGGTIKPSGMVLVKGGANKVFTITAAKGFKLSQVIVDGVATAKPSASYTFSHVSSPHNIVAVFVVK